jgi:hypothetical protein
MPQRQSKRRANTSHQANVLFLNNSVRKAIARIGDEKGGKTAPPSFSPLGKTYREAEG